MKLLLIINKYNYTQVSFRSIIVSLTPRCACALIIKYIMYISFGIPTILDVMLYLVFWSFKCQEKKVLFTSMCVIKYRYSVKLTTLKFNSKLKFNSIKSCVCACLHITITWYHQASQQSSVIGPHTLFIAYLSLIKLRNNILTY